MGPTDRIKRGMLQHQQEISVIGRARLADGYKAADEQSI